MKYQIYKPNKGNTGCAASFSVGKNKDGSPCLFINAVQQASWDDKTKTGSFKANAKNPQKSTAVKMNHNEAGEMISSVKSRVPVVFFHKNGADTTIISFTPWDKNRVVKEKSGDVTYVSKAFGLSISKNASVQFKVAFEAGETEVLSLLLADFINQCLYYEGNKFESGGEGASEELLGGSAPKEEKPAEKPADDDWDDSSDVPF